MRSRLQRIEIRNFKAFREFVYDLEGRHLLVYGPNGSGKSSLYWALYTFLQSARKAKPGVDKYFDSADPENLLNIHEQNGAAPRPGEIALTIRDTATTIDTTYRISHATHGTYLQPAILKGDLASDFITYRFFFGFSHFKNSERFNLWPLFEKEILPFCVSTAGKVPLDSWNAIKSGDPNPDGSRGLGGARAYEDFTKKVADFAAILPGIVTAISDEAQRFYDQYFAVGDTAKVTLKLAVITGPSAAGTNQANFAFTTPVVEFGIQIGGNIVSRPQAFLNEAKLTQLALSVRFAASLVNLHDSDLKLLVLDDLLVSLDMSNRMKVVEILLGDTFANYQKIILTHDLGFFREVRRRIGSHHPEWVLLRLEGDAATKIEAKNDKNDLQKAEDYLHGHNLDEAAICLRKAAEDTARRYREWADKKALPPGEFFSLTTNLRAARERLLEQIPARLYEQVLRCTPPAHREHLIRPGDDDLDALAILDVVDRGRLRTQRRRLRTLLTSEHWKAMENVGVIDDVLKVTERVTNPSAHAGDPPLYEAEVQAAFDLIKQLQSLLPSI